MTEGGNGWTMDKTGVEAKLDAHGRQLTSIEERVYEIHGNFSEMRGKVIAWGAIAALLVSGAVQIAASAVAAWHNPDAQAVEVVKASKALNDSVEQLIKEMESRHPEDFKTTGDRR